MGDDSQARNCKVTWAEFARDVSIAAINKGQLPILGVILVFVVFAWRMPPEDIPNLILQVTTHFRNHEMLGYALAFVTSFFWFIHTNLLKKRFNEETARIGSIKSDLQESLVGLK